MKPRANAWRQLIFWQEQEEKRKKEKILFVATDNTSFSFISEYCAYLVSCRPGCRPGLRWLPLYSAEAQAKLYPYDSLGLGTLPAEVENRKGPKDCKDKAGAKRIGQWEMPLHVRRQAGACDS